MFYVSDLLVFLAGQMVVTDVCHSTKRAEALGKLGISYGVGMVIGPFVGGLMTRYMGYSMFSV